MSVSKKLSLNIASKSWWRNAGKAKGVFVPVKPGDIKSKKPFKSLDVEQTIKYLKSLEKEF